MIDGSLILCGYLMVVIALIVGATAHSCGFRAGWAAAVKSNQELLKLDRETDDAE